MGYYARGDYYRGDPFLPGFVGGLVAKAGKWAVKRITGSGLKKAAVGTAVATVAGTTIARAPQGSGNMPIQIGPVGVDPISIAPGGKPFLTFGTKKRRKMNPLNPKALRRSLRRAEGFEKFAKDTVNALYKTSSCGCSKRTRKFKKA